MPTNRLQAVGGLSLLSLLLPLMASGMYLYQDTSEHNSLLDLDFDHTHVPDSTPNSIVKIFPSFQRFLSEPRFQQALEGGFLKNIFLDNLENDERQNLMAIIGQAFAYHSELELPQDQISDELVAQVSVLVKAFSGKVRYQNEPSKSTHLSRFSSRRS